MPRKRKPFKIVKYPIHWIREDIDFRVAEVRGKGYGLVAERDLPRWSVLEYQGDIYSTFRDASSSTSSDAYVAEINRSVSTPVRWVNAQRLNGEIEVGGRINEPSPRMRSNCHALCVRGRLFIVSRYPIQQGEEITWNYGSCYRRDGYRAGANALPFTNRQAEKLRLAIFNDLQKLEKARLDSVSNLSIPATTHSNSN